MKKIFAVAFIAAGMACPAQDARQTGQDTAAAGRCAGLRSRVRQGCKRLGYNNGKLSSPGYTPHGNPGMHRNIYMHIPQSGKDICGKQQ